MDRARMLLVFCLAIISTDLVSRGGFPALSDAHPGSSSGYGIMGTTDEEDSEKWAKEQDKAFKKLKHDWFRRRFSGSGSGGGTEGSGSGSNSNKPNKPFLMLKNRLRSSDSKLGNKRQMGYDVQSFSETDTSKVINQAVAETIQENTTEPPPMPPTMPKTTSPVEPYTYLPNITIPQRQVTVNEVSENTTVKGPGTATSSVNLKGIGSQNLSIKTSQKGTNGDNTNNTYISSGPKPGQPVSLHVGNNMSSIDLVDTKAAKGNDQPSSYVYYAGNSGSQVQEQQSPTLNATLHGLPQTAQVQPTVTPPTPATNNNPANFSYSYNAQNQMGASTQNNQPAYSSNNQVEGYASNMPNSTSSNMNPAAVMATSVETNNGNVSSNQPSILAETTTNYYLGGVQIQNPSSTNGQQSQTQQESLPTRSTVQWQNTTQPLAQDAGQNPNPSVSPTQRADLTYGAQNSLPLAIQKTENQKPSFSIQFQTEVANPTKSQSLNIRPIQIGRLVTNDKDGRLVISSSSTYEIGQNVFNPGSSYQGSPASNGAEGIQNTQQQASNTNAFPSNTTYTISPTNKPNTVVTEGYSNQQNQKAIPTIYVTPPKSASPTPPSWLPTYSLLKSMKMGALASKTQPDQSTAEASINITEILFPKSGNEGLPVMVMQSPSVENNQTVLVKPPPIPLVDIGSSQAKLNAPNLGQFQLPNVSPTQGATQGPTQILTQGQSQGPTIGPTQILTQGQTQGPANGPTQILTQGQTQGPTNGPTQILTQGQTQGPTNGPNQKSPQSATQGPTKVLTQKFTQGPTQGQAPTSAASTSMFALGSNPTVVGTVNPTAGISTATSKLPAAESSASLLGGEETAAGNMTDLIPNIEESGTISLPGSQTDELTVKEMENMMHVEDNKETLFGNKDSMSNQLPKSDTGTGGEGEDATPQKPIQALISQVPTADPYKDVKDALLSVDIAQLRPGELLSLRLPNSQTSDIFQVKDIKSNDDVSAYTSDLDIESENMNHGGSRDRKHILYAIIEKVKHNKSYRNAMKALFSTGDRRSWKNSKQSGSFVKGKSKTIELPQRAILRSYSKDELDKKNEEEFAKLLQENIGSMKVAGSNSVKEMKTPDIEFDQVHHDVEKYAKKDKIDGNTLRAKLLSVRAKMHRLHRKSSVGSSKRSRTHERHRHYNKKTLSDENGSKKTEGTFEVTLNVSGKKKKKSSEDKTKEDDESEKPENKLKPGSKLKFKGTFSDEKEESGEEDKAKKLQTEITSDKLKPNGQPGNVIIEDEKGNVLYKGPVDIAALNQTVTKKGDSDSGFQLQNVGYRVDPSASSEENVVLKQGLQQVIPKKRSGRFLHRRHRIEMHQDHLRRRYSRSIETYKDVKATKKNDGTFKLTLKVSGEPKGAATPETNKEGKDDVNMNDPNNQLFHDDKKLTFSGTFTDGEDSKDENEKKKKKDKEEEEEEEEKEEEKKKKKKKGKKEAKEEEEEEEEENEEEKKKKKKGKKKKKEEENEKEEEEEEGKEKKKGKKKKKEEENEEEEEEEEEKEKKKKGEKKEKNKEEEEEEAEKESKDKKKGEKSQEKELSNMNNQGNNTSMAQPKANATNVIIEDGKGNILYKGPVDIAALNKTVSTKNGTYSGFHLETAGYKVEESTDPQEVELLNDGLQHAINPNGEGNPQPLQLFEPKRKRRSLLEDSQPSKKTDGTFTITLALKDDKKKKAEKKEESKEENKEEEAKEDQQEQEVKPDKDGYYSDFQQKGDNSNKETKMPGKFLKKAEDSKNTSEKAKSLSPHVIIEDEHGKPLYQGPVDITALNKSVASKGGSVGYELQKTGYQLVKDPNQDQPASQSEATSSQNDVVNEESSEDSNNSINPAGELDQIKQHVDDSGTNVIKISSNTGDASSSNQGEQQVSVDVTNDDGSQDHSMSAVGKEQQSMGALQTAPNIKPSNTPSNKQEPEDGTKIPSYASKQSNSESNQKASKSESNPLSSFDKEYAEQQAVSSGETNLMQGQMDKTYDNHKENFKETSSNTKVQNQGKKGSDQHKVPVSSISFVDTTNSKLLHIYKPKQDLSSKNRKLEGNSRGNDQSLPPEVPSDEPLHDEKNSESKESLGSSAKPQKGMKMNNKENSYNVLLTDARNGASSIGGKILEPVIDEQKSLEQNEGFAQVNSMAHTIPNDSQVDVSDSSSLNNKNTPNQNEPIIPKNLAFLTQHIPPNVQMNEASMKAPASPISLAGQNFKNNVKHFPKQYQVLKLTRNKLKELLANTANSASTASATSATNVINTASAGKEQQQFPVAEAMQDNPNVGSINAKKVSNNGIEQPITLILSGPYLDQLETQNISASIPTNALSNDQMPNANLATNALSNDQMTTASLPTNALYNDQITTASLPTNALSNDQMKTASLPTNALANNQMKTASLPANALSNDQMKSASLPTNALYNDQTKTASQINSNQVNMAQTNVNAVNALLNNPEGKNITTILPNEMFANDDDKILIGGGGRTVRPAAAAEGVFKSQEAASGLNVLLKNPAIQNPAFLLQGKNTSPFNNLQGTQAMPTISVLSGSGQRVDCHALPAGSSLTLLRCGPKGHPIVGPTVSTLSKDQAASMLSLPMNDMPPQNPVPQHQLTEPDVAQNILGAPDIRMNDEPQSSTQRVDPSKQEYGYGTVTDPTVYHKMSTDIKDYLDKEINDEKNMIQNLLVGSSSPRASLPSQNNDDDTDDGLPFGFEYIPGASENNLYDMETRNQQMYKGFPNEYINTLSNPGPSRRPHKTFRSRSRHRNTRRSQIRKAYQRPGPWKRKKSSRKRVRGLPVKHWSFRGMFPPPVPFLIHPLYPRPWLLTKRCCSDSKNNENEKCKCSKTASSPSKNTNLPTPAPDNMSEWEYLGRVLCSCPCCIACVDW